MQSYLNRVFCPGTKSDECADCARLLTETIKTEAERTGSSISKFNGAPTFSDGICGHKIYPAPKE